jgi:oxygen-independent coproporphyrinogen III oxidase
VAEPGPDRIPNSQSLIPRPGLYVHVPFCAAICSYCNFNRGLLDEALKTRYVSAVLAEMRREGRRRGRLESDTLYFGGGTPSLLAPSEIRRIVEEARDSWGLDAAAEVTLEANPETVTAGALEQFRAAGVNRLSVGVQSFRDDELRRLGRLHTAARAGEVVRLAREAGFENLSLDLMMWLPGQDLAQWSESVTRAIELAPDHLSLYILEVYSHLPLRRDIETHGWLQVSDDDAADMYEAAMRALQDAGYEQYEISNVCTPGRESRHNLKYWTDGAWFGFGPGAHSTSDGVRWRNVSSTDEYVDRMAQGASVDVDRHELTQSERLGDALFMGLRLTSGIDVDRLSERYGVDIWQEFGARLHPFVDGGVLSRQDGILRLSRRGMLLANEVMSVFV